MATCVVLHCRNQARDGYALRIIPRDELIGQQWRDAIDSHGKVDWKCRQVHKVCEVHFKRDDWIKYRGTLKKDAVPSVFPVQPARPRKPKKIPLDSVDFIHEDHIYCKAPSLCPVNKPLREVQPNNSSLDTTPLVPKLPLPRNPAQQVFTQSVLQLLKIVPAPANIAPTPATIVYAPVPTVTSPAIIVSPATNNSLLGFSCVQSLPIQEIFQPSKLSTTTSSSDLDHTYSKQKKNTVQR